MELIIKEVKGGPAGKDIRKVMNLPSAEAQLRWFCWGQEPNLVHFMVTHLVMCTTKDKGNLLILSYEKQIHSVGALLLVLH